MTKFQKIQKISSVIPFYSSIFVFFATMFELKKQKASGKKWFLFYLIFCLSGLAAFFLNAVIMSGKFPVLNYIASGLVLGVANILCVDLQIYGQGEKPSAKDFRIGMIIFLAYTALIILSGVLILGINAVTEVEDPNGETITSVANIQLEDILHTKKSCTSFVSSTSYEGTHTKVAQDLEEYDRDVCRYQSKKLSGILTLQATQSEHNSLTLYIDSSLTKGNLEFFVIVDGALYERIPANTSPSVTVENAAGKLVIVRLAAEDAACSVSVERKLDS